MIRFLSFSSGSCGNCYALLRESPGGQRDGILIDAGVSLRTVRGVLGSHGVDLRCIKAILVTHDHWDHIRSLGMFCKKLSVPVYATSLLHGALSGNPLCQQYISPCRRDLVPLGWNPVAPGFEARYFVVPHDATETVGYAIRSDGHLFVLMTDLGSIPPDAMELAKQADTVVIESNFDVDMLLGGDYPRELKMRISEGHGHLSNDACAEAVKSFWHPGLRNLYLCHLSGNNNTPSIASRSAKAALEEIGARDGTDLRVLERGVPSPLLILQR